MNYPIPVKIAMLEARKSLLNARDAAMNANIVHKIDRKLRRLRAMEG